MHYNEQFFYTSMAIRSTLKKLKYTLSHILPPSKTETPNQLVVFISSSLLNYQKNMIKSEVRLELKGEEDEQNINGASVRSPGNDC